MRKFELICFSVAALLGFSGVALTIAPIEQLVIPPFPEKTTVAAGKTRAAFDASTYAARFDLSALPAPIPPEPPPPDPAQRLKEFRYLGMASSEDRIRAMFADASGTITLKPGDELGGFRLVEIAAARALFVREGLEFELVVNLP
jgi:hypothetical protein